MNHAGSGGRGRGPAASGVAAPLAGAARPRGRGRLPAARRLHLPPAARAAHTSSPISTAISRPTCTRDEDHLPEAGAPGRGHGLLPAGPGVAPARGRRRALAFPLGEGECGAGRGVRDLRAVRGLHLCRPQAHRVILLPERFFAFMPKQFFLTIVRAFGQARIDKEKRTASTSVRLRPWPRPNPPAAVPAELTALLGAPMETRTTEAGLLWRYRYQARLPRPALRAHRCHLHPDPSTRAVPRIHGRVFDATLDHRVSRLDRPASRQ